jgi:hypothetical protein
MTVGEGVIVMSLRFLVEYPSRTRTNGRFTPLTFPDLNQSDLGMKTVNRFYQYLSLDLNLKKLLIQPQHIKVYSVGGSLKFGRLDVEDCSRAGTGC